MATTAMPTVVTIVRIVVSILVIIGILIIRFRQAVIMLGMIMFML
jgi:hypothetical protein